MRLTLLLPLWGMLTMVSAAKQPNIIFIMADDLGWNDVGFHNPKLKTPNMNWLAKEGIELTNHYAQPVCSPSRSALMTGKYPSNNGLSQFVIFPLSKSCLPLEHKILPQYLKELGYATKYVGKWHLGECHENCLPTNRGIDEFRGILFGQADYFQWVYTEKHGVVERYVNDSVSLENIGTHLTLLEKSDVKEMIVAHKGKDSPLFMMVSTTAPHTPLQTTEEMYNTHDFLNGSEPESIKRRKYLGLVSAVDDIIGETIQSLKDADLYNNSVIIFTSDNGGTSLPYRFPGLLEAAGNNYPLRSGKGSMLEGGVKVPTLYFDTRLPQKYAGTKRDFLIHISDWLPTMMHLAGNDSFDVSLDGVSQYGNLRGSYSELKKYCARRELLLSLTNYSALSTETLCGASDAAFRFEDWKLLYGIESGVASHSVPTEWVKPAESPELPDITGDSCFRLDEKGNQVLRCLFNLKEDPYEQTNLYDSHPQIVEQMVEMINKMKAKRVQNIFKRSVDINVASRMYGGHLVHRSNYCDPAIDFPLQPVHPSCISEFSQDATEGINCCNSCSNSFICSL